MIKKVNMMLLVFVSILFLSANLCALVCPKCNANNDDKAKFCNECGAKLGEVKSKEIRSSKANKPSATTKSSAAVFDGESYIVVSSSDTLPSDFFSSSNWTIEMWVNPAELSGKYYWICANWNPRLMFAGGLVFSSDGGPIIDTAPGDFTANEWNYLAVVSNGKTYQMYINGVMKYKKPYRKIPAVLKKLVIGSDADDLTRNYKGMIDDVRIYNKALTEEEVKGNYDKTNITTEGLVSWWKLDGDTKDSVGTNDATVVGEVTFEVVE